MSHPYDQRVSRILLYTGISLLSCLAIARPSPGEDLILQRISEMTQEVVGLVERCEDLSLEIEEWMVYWGHSDGFFDKEDRKEEREELRTEGRSIEIEIERLSLVAAVDQELLELLEDYARDQRDLCRTVLDAEGTAGQFRTDVDEALDDVGKTKAPLQLALGTQLEEPVFTSPEEYSRKQKEWLELQKRRAEEKKALEEARAAREKERIERQRERQVEMAEQEAMRGRGAAHSFETAAEAERAAAVAGDQKLRALREWHDHYRRESAATKKELGATVAAMRSRKAGQLEASCSRLASRTNALLGKPVLLEVPDGKVEFSLRIAYSKIHELASVCLQGDPDELPDKLKEIQVALGKAAQALAPFELQP